MLCPAAAQQQSETDCPVTKSHRARSRASSRASSSRRKPSNSRLQEIPQPPPHLFGLLGNIPDVDFTYMFKDINRFHQLSGPIIKLKFFEEVVFVGNQELVNEVCDTKRFNKLIGRLLTASRVAAGDGLFTADNEDPNWGKAHRMLVPTFGPLGIQKMWGDMQDIASQMILKWDRLGPDHEIDCADDLTRLAFDTIGLCAFSYRFNQFYSEEVHPFAVQMADELVESGKKAGRPPLIQALHRRAERKRLADAQAMHALCDEIVADRKTEKLERALAQGLETAAKDRGFKTSVSSLDSATEDIPTDRPAVFITSSYEGLPPDNAKKFVTWLEGLKQDSRPLANVEYAVFGVGNSDWATTFQRIPKLVDDAIAKAGGTRIADLGTCNVKTDLIGPWDEWLHKLMTTLTAGDADSGEQHELALKAALQRRSSTSDGKAPNYGTIMVNKELAGTEMGPAKRHIEVQLPEDTPYTAGDYLVVQPRNPLASVRRITRFFDLNEHDVVSFSGTSKKFLPQEPTSLREFLSTAVELATPITKRQLEIVSRTAPADKKDVLSRMTDNYDTILEKRYSVIDLLEEAGVTIAFEQYVDMLQALAPRQYSISSSPLVSHDAVSLTIDVHESPALSGQGEFRGVASTYLASRRLGDRITCFVRPTQIGFRLPQPKTPLIMFAARTGIAPMQAFLQERSAIAQAQGAGVLGPAVLCFGCRHRDKDYIYRDELEQWEKQGIVKVLTAFSKMDDGEHRRYVPELLAEHKEELAQMFRDGGKVFLCGSAARLGKSVSEACVKLYAEAYGVTMEDAEKWLQGVKTDRYVSDVY